ncbi:secretion protein HlyD [Bremerella cremea]|uniref:Secretion protein HlyD n=1 Tax=Bremerella cremea TaxID=1031537 RepID=A0A368KW84_9BACT|nr:efflux RND transporter periplasmic adaptor subunit [Bremerella cremea]RCS53895.1 secretion protein HlyD [Bremerella cremea]
MNTHSIPSWVWSILTVAALSIVALVTSSLWLPTVRELVAQPSDPQHNAETTDPHAGHDHAHAGHAETTSVKLSANGLKNINYQPLTVELSSYTRNITVPAMIVERPGRTQLNISAPLTGVITKIYPVEGASIESGSPMFEIRLTHEELVTAQSDLIRTAENLDVINRELARLTGLPEGVVAGNRILEQQYEKQRLDASLRAERQSLLLHGLNEKQVANILENKQLLDTLTVHAPNHLEGSESCSEAHSFHVQKMVARVGQQVQAGELLGVIADHCELYIEGRAFEDDAVRLREVAAQQLPISASLLTAGKLTDEITGLHLMYLADHVDPQTRAFRFFVALPNEVVTERTTNDGQHFVEWRFKPGQRMELHIPVETWEDEIVLPVEAVVDEGAEKYVYQQNGDHFDQVPVNVKYRDQTNVVIANNGALFPGDVVAARGAYEMHLTLKNQAGGGVDPHAGHNH